MVDAAANWGAQIGSFWSSIQTESGRSALASRLQGSHVALLSKYARGPSSFSNSAELWKQVNPSEILTASGARSQLTYIEDFLRENPRFAVFFQCVGIPILFYFFLEGVSLLNREFF